MDKERRDKIKKWINKQIDDYYDGDIIRDPRKSKDFYESDPYLIAAASLILMGVGIALNINAYNKGYFEYVQNGEDTTIAYLDASFMTKWGLIVFPGITLILSITVIVIIYKKKRRDQTAKTATNSSIYYKKPRKKTAYRG